MVMGKPRWSMMAALGVLMGCRPFDHPQLPPDAFGVVELPWDEASAPPPDVPFGVIDLFEAYKQARLTADSDEEIAAAFRASLEPQRPLLEPHVPWLYTDDVSDCTRALDADYDRIWRVHFDSRNDLPHAYARTQVLFPALEWGGTVIVLPGCMDAQGEAGIESDVIVISLASVAASRRGSIAGTFQHELLHHYHAMRAPGLFDGSPEVSDVVWREGLAMYAASLTDPTDRRWWRETRPDRLAQSVALVSSQLRSTRPGRVFGTRRADPLSRTLMPYVVGTSLVEQLSADYTLEELFVLDGEELVIAMEDGLADLYGGLAIRSSLPLTRY